MAQNDSTWQQTMEQGMLIEDIDEENGQEFYDVLEDMADQKININEAQRSDLEKIPFINDAQIQDILAYRDLHGEIYTMDELAMIPSIEREKRILLKRFFYAGQIIRKTPLTLKNLYRYGKNKLVAYTGIPFYKRKGDYNGYLGYPIKHWIRYNYSYRNQVKAGLVASQDAGEPFGANKNKYGYDYYAAYVLLENLGRIKTLALGKYKIKQGLGLIINKDLTFGKFSSINYMGRTKSIIRPHSSRSMSNYLQGVAGNVSITKSLDFIAFFSYRPIDATLNKEDGTIHTIINNGYHRSINEMAKKDNASETVMGTAINWKIGNWGLGATTLYTHYDAGLKLNIGGLYRRFFPVGKDFFYWGINYSWYQGRFAFAGETATEQKGALATINKMHVKVTDELEITAMQRFYSYKYYALHGNALGENRHCNNESGFLVGWQYKFNRDCGITGYNDWSYSPFAKFRVSKASSGWEHYLNGFYQRKHMKFMTAYKIKKRDLDNKDNNSIDRVITHRAKASLQYDLGTVTAQTKCEGTWAISSQTEKGWMVTQSLMTRIRPLELLVSAAYFNTDGYRSRIYAYERSMYMAMTFPAMMGKGYRASLLVKGDINKNMHIYGKCGMTKYMDRQVISSGLQTIYGNTQTDAELQLICKW